MEHESFHKEGMRNGHRGFHAEEVYFAVVPVAECGRLISVPVWTVVGAVSKSVHLINMLIKRPRKAARAKRLQYHTSHGIPR